MDERIEFDLAPVAPAAARSNRRSRRIAIVAGASFLAVWGVVVLPFFFLQPHPIYVCGKGACAWFPASGYWIAIGLESGVTAGLGAIFLLLAYFVGRRVPARLSIDSRGLEITYTRGRRARVAWPPWWNPMYVSDYRARPRGFGPGLQIPGRLNDQAIALSGEAIDGLLAKAKSLGLIIQATQVNISRISTDPGYIVNYRIRGRRSGSPQPDQN